MVDTPDTYKTRVEVIKQHIAAGETYQVNLTTQLQGDGQVNFATFCRIARDAPYGAYISADNFDIVSASPELFFQCDPGYGDLPADERHGTSRVQCNAGSTPGAVAAKLGKKPSRKSDDYRYGA